MYENLKNTEKEIQGVKASFAEYYETAGLTDENLGRLLNHLEDTALGFD